MYRGAVKHTDGFYGGCGVIVLNLLIGNPDWKGGLQKGGGHWHETGGKEASVYNFGSMHPNKMSTFGPPITREKSRYEESSWFREEGYPAKRPWYPFTSNVYQEVIPSFAQGYPYAGQILFVHKGTPVLSTPAGDRVIEYLRDQKKIPLFIASDIVIGETSMYADYILPDLTYLERWGMPHPTPDVITTMSKVRQPIGQPLTEEVVVDDETMPLCLETFLMALGKKMNLPGFGKGAFGEYGDFNRMEDWFLKEVANIAMGDKAGEAVPNADENEMQIFRQARRHLPASIFDESKWKRTVSGDLWPKVVHVLNRGGRFADFDTAYDGQYMAHKLGKMFHFFMDDVAGQKNSMSGEYFIGYARYLGQFDSAGHPLQQDGDYPYALITYKEPFGGQSRTISNYWSNVELQAANRVVINKQDADRVGLKKGDRVRVVSATNPEGVWRLGGGRTSDMIGEVDIC